MGFLRYLVLACAAGALLVAGFTGRERAPEVVVPAGRATLSVTRAQVPVQAAAPRRAAARPVEGGARPTSTLVEAPRDWAPDPEQLSFEHPITVVHPDASVSVHKLARVTRADGTEDYVPVTLRADPVARRVD